MSEKNTRYAIGQEIEVIGFNYCPGEENLVGRRPFSYDEMDYPLSIELFKLKVIEHHKVAWNKDPEGQKCYDGFILCGEDRSTWYNQYPTADYNLISNHADQRFTLRTANTVSGDKVEKRSHFSTVETLAGFIKDFHRVVQLAEREIHNPDQAMRNRAHLIIKFFDDLTKQIFEKYQKKIHVTYWNVDTDDLAIVTKVELIPANEAGCIRECGLNKLFK